MTKDEALDLALELRELADRFSEGWHDGIKIDASDIMLLSMAASQIEQSRSAPVQEPVHQWQQKHSPYWYDGYPDNDDGGGPYETRILYTTPPAQPVPVQDVSLIDEGKTAAQRKWTGLTDEEIQTTWDSVMNGAVFTRREVYKAIEAKLKERNT